MTRLIAHLGLGAFFRAHQAWYTEVANRESTERWDITAFTGRSPGAAQTLAAAGFSYPLVVLDADGSVTERVHAVTAAYDGGDADAWRHAMRDAAIVTLTITEAGYAADHADAELLAAGRFPHTAPGRLVDGLRARRDAGGGAIALVSCDNLRGNGTVLRDAVRSLATLVDASLTAWIDAHVSFVSTVVDRITPALDPSVLPQEVRDDPTALATEPATTWQLAGDFPAGRPAWELAGAEFVDDVAPYERRKLWVLNAGHTLLASLGRLRGHTTVADCMSDTECVTALEALWDDAAAVLPFPDDEIGRVRASVTARFRNPRIRHELAQIARDAELKLRERVVPVVTARIAQGLHAGDGELTAVAAWIAVGDGPADAASAVDRLGLPPQTITRIAELADELGGIERNV